MMIISDFLLGICLNHGEKKLTWLAGKPPISSIGNYIFKWWIFHCRVGFRVVLFGLWTSCHFFFMLKKMTNISSKFLGAFLTEKKKPLPSDRQHHSTSHFFHDNFTPEHKKKLLGTTLSFPQLPLSSPAIHSSSPNSPSSEALVEK